MAIASNQPMTLEEYLNYDDGTDTRYELVDGHLTEVGAESPLNYIDKRREYAQRGIPEYWIVDPAAAVALVLSLVGQEYQKQRFVGDEQLVSPGFPQLELRADQVLQAEV